jgi:hypothetical protein
MKGRFWILFTTLHQDIQPGVITCWISIPYANDSHSNAMHTVQFSKPAPTPTAKHQNEQPLSKQGISFAIQVRSSKLLLDEEGAQVRQLPRARDT